MGESGADHLPRPVATATLKPTTVPSHADLSYADRPRTREMAQLAEVNRLISTEGAFDPKQLNILKEQLHDDWRIKNRTIVTGVDDRGNPGLYLRNSDGSFKRQPRPKVDHRTTSDTVWMGEAQKKVDDFAANGRMPEKVIDDGKEFMVFDNIVVDNENQVIGCDIANTAGSQLPEGWKNEQLKAAQVALATAQLIDEGLMTYDEGVNIIHIKWIEFNPWASENQKVPFAQLSHEDQQRDKDQLDLARALRQKSKN